MKYKAIRSAARNFAHSFTSVTNHVGDDYAMSHLTRAVVASGHPELRVDLLTGDAGPDALLTAPIRASIAGYLAWFPALLASQGIAMWAVRDASLRVTFDLRRLEEPRGVSGPVLLPFQAVVEITDDRGKPHVGRVWEWWKYEPRRVRA